MARAVRGAGAAVGLPAFAEVQGLPPKGALVDLAVLRAREGQAEALERGRVVESHADALSEAYGNVPVDIADAFGLPEHLGVTHVEAIVRAGVPFQISRYIAPMLRAASDAAGVRPGGYDAVSGGATLPFAPSTLPAELAWQLLLPFGTVHAVRPSEVLTAQGKV